MAKSPQQEAEDQLAQELQKHLQAKEAQDDAQRDVKASRKQHKQAALKTIREGFLLTHTNFNSWWEATSLVIFPALAWAFFADGSRDGAALPILAGLGLGFGYLIYFCDTYGGIFARIFLAMERGYLKRLPFEAEGYWTLIGKSPSGDEACVLATLKLSADTSPKKELVEGILRKFQEGFYTGSNNPHKISWSDDLSSVTLQSHKLSTPYYGKQKPRLRSAADLHGWAKAFLQQAEALHKAYPIDEINFSRQ